MIVSAMQPYYFPSIHYYQLIFASDVFIILDNVNFINRGFIHKNFYIDTITKEKKIFNLIIEKKSQNKLIKDLKLKDYKNSFQKLKKNYEKNKNFSDIYEKIIEKKIFQNKYDLVIDLLLITIKEICNLLEINTKIILSSSLKQNKFSAQNKILDYVKQLNGKQYINFIGGSHLYDKKLFKKNSIKLKFLKNNLVQHSNVSILHILAENGLDETKNSLIKNYQLI
tara:strand:- start:1013 stop:1687 length:675 start_codon:yes stop_codon:yes gene_type:complete